MADRQYGNVNIPGPKLVGKAKGADTITPMEQSTWAGSTHKVEGKSGGSKK